MFSSLTPTSVGQPQEPRRGMRLVSTASHELPEQLAGAIDGHLATSAEHVGEVLLDLLGGLRTVQQLIQRPAVGSSVSAIASAPTVPRASTHNRARPRVLPRASEVHHSPTVATTSPDARTHSADATSTTA